MIVPSTRTHHSFGRISSSFSSGSTSELAARYAARWAPASRKPRCRPRSAGRPWNAVDCRASRRTLRSRSPTPPSGRTGRTMTSPPTSDSSSAVERPPDDRLDSWKEIAAYMRRDVTTVQRWEKREGMPVHRHVHDKMGSIYAFKTDLDAWARRRSLALAAEPDVEPVTITSTQPPSIPAPRPRRRRWGAWLAGAAGEALSTLAIWQLQKSEGFGENPLADARFSPLTDFDGIEQAAAISRGG